jgi:hypothetical protein
MFGERCCFVHINRGNQFDKLKEEYENLKIKVIKIEEKLQKCDEIITHQNSVQLLEKIERFHILEKEIMEKDKLIEKHERQTKEIEETVNALKENMKKSSEKMNKKPLKSFKCCDFQTDSRTGLKIHKKRKHTSVSCETFPAKCELCDEEIKTKHKMKKHMLGHSVKRAYLKGGCSAK